MEGIIIANFLKNYIGNTIEVNQLHDLGFDCNALVASKMISDESSLLNRIIYISEYYFEGVTISYLQNNIFKVVENSLSNEEATEQNEIAEMKRKIESLGNSIFAYRFEFDDNETAVKLEREKKLLEAIIKAKDLKKKLLNNNIE